MFVVTSLGLLPVVLSGIKRCDSQQGDSDNALRRSLWAIIRLPKPCIKPRIVCHHTHDQIIQALSLPGNKASLLYHGINWKSSRVVLCHFESMGSLLHGHVAIITETESTHIVNESILQLGVVPSLLSLLRAVERSHMWETEHDMAWERSYSGVQAVADPGGFPWNPPFTRKHC